MSLTDPKVKHAKSLEKEYKLTDGFGMQLLVHPKGSCCYVIFTLSTNQVLRENFSSINYELWEQIAIKLWVIHIR